MLPLMPLAPFLSSQKTQNKQAPYFLFPVTAPFFSDAFKMSSIQSMAASSLSLFAVVILNRFMYSMFVKRFGFFRMYSRISIFFSSANEKY